MGSILAEELGVIERTNPLLKVASSVKLFAGMDVGMLEKLLSCADKISIAGGELFFDEGDVGESFYVLVIGKVVVEQTNEGKWIRLARLASGDSFGEMTLVDDKRRSARVRAETECVALYFPMERIKPFPAIMASLYLNIARVLVKRLKTTNTVLLDLKARAPDSDEEVSGD